MYFMLHFEWFDDDLQFRFLKDNDNENTLSKELVDQIWTPDVEFEVIEKVIRKSRPQYYVSKRGPPKLEGDLNIKEVYEGSENSVNLLIKDRIRFTCPFDNIRNYPFGRQSCSLKFYLLGADNGLTDLVPKEFVDKGRCQNRKKCEHFSQFKTCRKWPNFSRNT